jgi:hypothetical protein
MFNIQRDLYIPEKLFGSNLLLHNKEMFYATGMWLAQGHVCGLSLMIIFSATLYLSTQECINQNIFKPILNS